MFARTAEIITQKLQKNNTVTSEQYDLCRFGFQQGLTILLNLLTTICIGVIMGEFWQSVLFMIAYAPLRSFAGGYHAKTSILCYVYSILMMITVLFAIKLPLFNDFICIIAFLVSCVIIAILSPVEDSNKPLDYVEIKVYRKRTLVIISIESMFFIISYFFNWKNVVICITYVFMVMAFILCAGKCKNIIYKSKKMFTNKKGKINHEEKIH